MAIPSLLFASASSTVIAWGGVAAQFLVAIPFAVLDAMWSGPLGYLGPPVLIFVYWSAAIGVLNLLPLPGLDGAIAWSIVPLLRRRNAARHTVSSALKRFRRNTSG